MSNLRDLLFEDDETVRQHLRGLDDGRLHGEILALWDLDRRWTGEQGDRCHQVLVMAAEERDERGRANDSMLSAVFPTVDLGEVPLTWRERALDWWYLARAWIRPRWMPDRRA
ncbi:hypothetical protein OG558_19740 [Kribbella sp. NBC_01510]|uniref:hypothetical protein n=1 Tax=Kribbella sp. NBC_01510 TaxID=2903581 RepID=UPI0038641B7F